MSVKKKLSRGFILVVVLIGVLAVSVAVLIQLDTASSTQITSLRQNEAAWARAYAEQCLDLGNRVANAYLTNTGAIDFDCLLDSGGAGCDGVNDNDHVPQAADMPGSTVVYIPKAEALSPPARRAQHRFRYMPIDAGGCFLRFDDNTDEFLTAATFAPLTDNTGAGEEGPALGREVLHRDRDRTIFITAIGVHPRLGATPADHYEAGHSRVTLRRAFGTALSARDAIAAGGGVTVEQNAEICGNGSISAGAASNLDLGVTGCMCGDMNADTCVGTCPLPGCTPAQCTTCSDNTPSANPSPATPPTVTVPTVGLTPGALALESFAKDVGGTTNLGANGVCEFWFKGGGVGEIFYWDHEDAGNSCDSYTTDPVERPCSVWDVSTDPATPTCVAGETPCWKLAGRYDGTDVAPGKAATLINSSPTRNSWDVEARFNGVSNTPWSAFCGGCAACGGNTGTVTYDDASDAFLLEDTWDNDDFPTPAYVYVENPAGNDLFFGGNEGNNTWGASGPLKITWITNQGVDFDSSGGRHLCGAECDCSGLVNIGAFTCDITEPQLPPASERECAVVRARGRCDLDNGNDRYFGALQCNEVIADSSDPCVAGDIIAQGPGPGTHDCSSGGSPAFCTTTSICFNNNGNVIGDLTSDGSICMKNGGVVNGDIATTDGFFARNNTTINGTITAEDDVHIGNNTRINPPGGGSPNLFRFIEAPW
jgi:hypothetical protein